MPTDTTTDTTPGDIDPSTLDGYEPEVPNETTREKRARKARNRRRAEKVQREAQAATGTAPTPGRPSKQGKRAAAVTGIVTGVGIGVYAFDEHDGAVIIEGAPALGDSLAKVAEKNAKVAKALDALSETSAWAEVGIAVGAIVLPIVKHHAPAFRLSGPEPHPGDANDPTTRRRQTAPAADEPAPPDARPQVRDDAPAFVVAPTLPDAAPPVPTFTTRGN